MDLEAPASTHPAGEPFAETPIARLNAVDQRTKHAWSVDLFRDRMECTSSESGDTALVARREISQKVVILDWSLMRRVLKIKNGARRLLQFSPEGFEIVTRWIGPPTRAELAAAVKRQFWWVLVLGAMFVLTSLPLSDGSQTGEPLPFRPFDFGLGVAMITVSLISWVIVHRVILVLESLWLIAIAGNLVRDVAQGAHWLWLLVAVFLVISVSAVIGQYQRFHTVVATRSDVFDGDLGAAP